MKRISARGIIIVNDELVTIFRRKIVNGEKSEYYVIPGGGVDENESLEEGLKRELREELNIEVNIKGEAFVSETDSRIEHFYNCEYLSGEFKLNGEELDRMNEENYYEITFIKLNEIEKYNLNNDIKEYLKK